MSAEAEVRLISYKRILENGGTVEIELDKVPIIKYPEPLSPVVHSHRKCRKKSGVALCLKSYSTARWVGNFPRFISLVCFVQIFIYFFVDCDMLIWYLIFNPYRRYEIWRFWSVFLIHLRENYNAHLWSNVIFEVMAGIPLEVNFGWRFVASVYFAGVGFATLCQQGFTHPWSYAFGASGGATALLVAGIPSLILNWNEQSLSCAWFTFYLIATLSWTVPSVFGLIAREGIYYDANDGGMWLYTGHTSHLAGALGGFLMATILTKIFIDRRWKQWMKYLSGLVLILLFVACVAANIFYQVTFYGLALPIDNKLNQANNATKLKHLLHL